MSWGRVRMSCGRVSCCPMLYYTCFLQLLLQWSSWRRFDNSDWTRPDRGNTIINIATMSNSVQKYAVPMARPVGPSIQPIFGGTASLNFDLSLPSLTIYLHEVLRRINCFYCFRALSYLSFFRSLNTCARRVEESELGLLVGCTVSLTHFTVVLPFLHSYVLHSFSLHRLLMTTLSRNIQNAT